MTFGEAQGGDAALVWPQVVGYVRRPGRTPLPENLAASWATRATAKVPPGVTARKAPGARLSRSAHD